MLRYLKQSNYLTTFERHSMKELEKTLPGLSRRDFVRTVRDGAFLLVLPSIVSCRAQVPSTNETPYSLKFLTPKEAETVDAIASRIFPTDNLPGAREAYVVHFIDHMLATNYQEQQQL